MRRILLLSALVVVACSSGDEARPGAGAGGAGGAAGTDASAGGAAGTTGGSVIVVPDASDASSDRDAEPLWMDGSAFDASLTDFCSGVGAIAIPGQADCTGDIGKKVFRFAMCSCGDDTAQNTVDTDSIDSTKGGAAREGGSIGVDGNYKTTAPTTIKGALVVAGNLDTSNNHDVVQNLLCGGTAYVGSPATVDSDAYVGGVVSGSPNYLTVAGKLYTPVAGNTYQVHAIGGVKIAPVSVPAPCECSTPVDVAAIVAAFKNQNDDDANGILPDALTHDPNVAKDITLPCGRYFLAGVYVDNPATIHLQGRTVLAIEGNLEMSGLLTIDMAPGAELDLFITGNVFLNSAATIGKTASPASTRIYIGGTSVTMTGQLALSANFYLPHADFAMTSDLELWGAVFAKSILTTGHIKVHYDEAILSIPGCHRPETPCTSCNDCVNPLPACGAKGKCGPCTSDTECCSPLVCDAAGTCVAPPPK
jgi:hypothetical protein